MIHQSLIESSLTEFAASRPAPYLVVAICRRGALLESAAFASTGFAPLTDPNNTSFRIASMTKSFAAAATLRLRDEGKLSLGDSVTHHLPEMRLAQQWSNVTVAHLLSMRSGLPATDDPWADRKLGESASFLTAELLNEAHFSNSPGEEYQYSNLGYMALGRIISNVAQVDARDYIDKNFLEPLGMAATSWNLPTANSVAGYRLSPGGFRPEQEFFCQADLALFAGLCSTIRDLAVWIDFLAEAHQGDRNARNSILSASSRRKMQRLQAVMHPINSTDQNNFPIAYGYGLRGAYIGREWYVGHSGGLPGYGSHMSWSTVSGLGVIAMGNVTYAPAAELCRNILSSLQADSPRTIAQLPRGEEIVVERGQALLAAILSDADLPREFFSYNVPQDEEMEALAARLREVIEPHRGKQFEIKPERGFAGAIVAEGVPLVFFSLAPVDGCQIQKIRYYPAATGG